MTSIQPARRRRVRASTIVWGSMLVAASIFAIAVLLGGHFNAATVLWTVIGFGTVLILAAIVTAAVRAARSRPSMPIDSGAAEDRHPPVG